MRIKYKPVIYLTDETEVHYTVACGLLGIVVYHQFMAVNFNKHVELTQAAAGWAATVFELYNSNSHVFADTPKLFLWQLPDGSAAGG